MVTPEQRLERLTALRERNDDPDVQYLIKYWMERNVLCWHVSEEKLPFYLVDQEGSALLVIYPGDVWEIVHEFPQGGLPEFSTREEAIDAALAIAKENGYVVTGTP